MTAEAAAAAEGGGTALRPATEAELREAVRATPHVLPRGGATKPALSSPPAGVATIEVGGLRGIVDYDPGEFTVTARAGTPLAELEAALAANGQYLPFDPPLAGAGATVGGALASGLSGPGRWRYGGIRDFGLQVRFVNASGEVVRGGAKVVKNAAGFDLPRLMAGSLGRLGVLVEVTFKVLPAPEARATLTIPFAGVDEAADAMLRLGAAPLELESLDLVPDDDEGGCALWVRLGGLAAGLPSRVQGVVRMAGGANRAVVLEGEAEAATWADARDFAWVPDGWCLLDVPLSPSGVAGLEAILAGTGARRRYCAGGNLAYVGCPEPLDEIAVRLAGAGLGALVIRGPRGRPLLGVRDHAFGRRVREALDPGGRFPEIWT